MDAVPNPYSDVFQIVGDMNIEFQDLGEHDFKGLSEPLHLYLVIPSFLRGRLEHSAPPVKSPISDIVAYWFGGLADHRGAPNDYWYDLPYGKIVTLSSNISRCKGCSGVLSEGECWHSFVREGLKLK